MKRKSFIIKGLFYFSIVFLIGNTTFAQNCATLIDGNTICTGGDTYWIDIATSNNMTTAELSAHFGYAAELHGGAIYTENGITCANGNYLVINPQPPAPVITTSSYVSGGCSSYISSWNTNWSTCAIQGTWNTNGQIQCKQIPSYSPISSSCGSQTVTQTCVNGVCSTSYGPCTGCPGNVPQPNYPDSFTTISILLDYPNTSGNAYANNQDSNIVKLNLSGTTKQNKSIVGWGTQGEFTNFKDASNVPSNIINNTGKALSITYSKDIEYINPNSELLAIPVKSKTPFRLTGKQISFNAGGIPLVIKNVNYHYKKPFIGEIKVKDSNNGWSGQTTLGTQNTYKLGLVQKSNLTWNGLVDYNLNDFSTDIEVNGNGIHIQSPSVNSTTLDLKTGTIFTARINTNSGETVLNQSPGLQLNLPIISYTLGGEPVKYYLSQNDIGDDITPIKTVGSSFLGVKVIGGLQGQGKGEMTGQNTNISNLYNSEQRTKIRKNAYNYIKSMKSGEEILGVKYVKGDITISGEQSYETLVVIDGNVIINGDLNTSKKKLGIIVLKDNYDINKDYNNQGNIYLTPNVTKINAIIYADGGIISTNISGNPYTTDTSERTQDLNKQLILQGSIFTRNTIGGAILGGKSGGSYIMPGGSKTQEFDDAMIYDLNYIRRGNSGCDKNADGNCSSNGEYTDAFVIIYDSRVQITPPKLFEN